MEDSEGVLNFDFEGGLDAQPSAAIASASVPAAPSGPIIQPDSYLPPSNA
ncbi:cleavage and polyadenylation specificity factor CPSF30-like, partial [Trifolium medium]|nr:cleavage and polyadenylation specificity factor CPSF30-like [Trifolium medium]